MVAKRVLHAFIAVGVVGGLMVVTFTLLNFFVPPVTSDTLIIPNTFSIGQVADPATVNANFTAIANVINGKIDNTNWDAAGPDLQYGNIDLESKVDTGDILDGTVALIDMAANSVDVTKVVDNTLTKHTTGTGDTTDIALPNTPTETVLLTLAYTPHSNNSLLLISIRVPIETALVSGGVRNVTIELYIDVDSVRERTGRWQRVIDAATDKTDRAWLELSVVVAAPSAGPFDIEIIAEAFTTFGTVTYYGMSAPWSPAEVSVLEFRK